MILFEPAVGGDTGGGAAVAEAPAASPAASAPEAVVPSIDEGAIVPSKQDSTPEKAELAPAEASKFRPALVEWAKEAGLTDEDLKDYGSEKALLWALKNQMPVEQVAPVKPVVEKPVEVPKAPVVKPEVKQVDELDVNQIPEFTDDVHPEIVAVVGALKRALSSIQSERAQEKAHFETLQEIQKDRDEPIYDAFDEFFAGEKEFEDVFGKGDHRAPQTLKEEQRAERAKVARHAMNLLREAKLKPNAQNIKKMADRAVWSLHTDRRLGKIQAAADQKVAIAKRQNQFIARPRPARAVTNDNKSNGPTDEEIQENIRNKLKK